MATNVLKYIVVVQNPVRVIVIIAITLAGFISQKQKSFSVSEEAFSMYCKANYFFKKSATNSF